MPNLGLKPSRLQIFRLAQTHPGAPASFSLSVLTIGGKKDLPVNRATPSPKEATILTIPSGTLNDL